MKSVDLPHSVNEAVLPGKINALPANESIQKIIDFLSDIIGDGETFDMGTLEEYCSEDKLDTEQEGIYEHGNNQQVLIRNPLGPFDIFLNKLLSPHSVEIVKSLQHFVSRITSTVWNSRRDVALLGNISTSSIPLPAISAGSTFSLDLLSLTTKGIAAVGDMNNDNPHRFSKEDLQIGELASVIWVYLDELSLTMRKTAPWSNESDEKFEQTKKDCERFLFLKLYDPLFQVASAGLEDQMANQRTRERIESLQFLSAEHLDIRSLQFLLDDLAMKEKGTEKEKEKGNREARLLTEPVQHLRELDLARSPEDKLLCVRRCSLAIAQLLKTAHLRKAAGSSSSSSTSASTSSSTGKGGGGGGPGADELLPVMILAIKCCNPLLIHSNIKFLQHFLRPARMVSEAGYLLTNLVSAVYFLDNVDAQALTIEPAEFDRAILKCKLQAKEANMKLLNKRTRNLRNPFLLSSLSHSWPAKSSRQQGGDSEGEGIGVEAEVDGEGEETEEHLFMQYEEEKHSLLKANFTSIHDVYRDLLS